MSSVAQGFKYFVRSLKVISSDAEIKKLAFIPVFLFVLLLAVGLFTGVFYIDEMLNLFFAQYIEPLATYWRALIYVVGFLFFSFLYYVFALFFTSVLSIPICASISNKTLKNHVTLALKDKTFKENVFSFLKMFRAAIAKVILLVFIALILFVTSFIPVLSPLAFVGSVIILSFDCMDFAFETLDYGFRDRIRFFKSHLGHFVGFALGLSLLIVIPFVQFIVLPVAVCGTTLFLAEEHKKRLTQGNKVTL